VNLSSHVKKQTLAANKKYPFGLDLPNPDPLIASAITDAVDQITDIADAIGDLGMAESVHHVVMGNYDRAAGVLETYSKGTYPQEPDVIRTPRSGTTLTHRVSIPFQYIGLAQGSGPRAQTEPSDKNWLSTIMPPTEGIISKCSYVRRGDGLAKVVEISLKDVGLKPIDLLYMMNALDSRAMNEMDDRFLFFLHATDDPQIDGNMVFQYTEDSADPSKLSLFQVMPLVRSLRALLVESVPLTPGDVALPNEASQQDVPPPELPA
jgi:hypothetical protein